MTHDFNDPDTRAEYRRHRNGYLLNAAALMLLLGVSVGVSFVPLGAWATPVALGIAAVKAALVALFFMHLWGARGVTRLFAVTGLVMFALLLGLTLLDVFSRGWLTPT